MCVAFTKCVARAALALWLGSILWLPATAKQDRRAHETEDSVEYHYIFDYIPANGKGQQQTVEFALTKAALSRSFALLPSNDELQRQASQFVVAFGKDRAQRHAIALNAGFLVGLAEIQKVLGQFNGRIGGRVVYLKTNPPHVLKLEVKATGKDLLDITVSSQVPAISTQINNESLFRTLVEDAQALTRSANKSLPQGLRYNLKTEWNSQKPSFRYWLTNEKRLYDTGTKNRANQLVSRTNAKLNTRIERYKQETKEARNVLEEGKVRARKLLDDYIARITRVRKSLLSELTEQKKAFYATNYLLPAPNGQDRTLIDYARIARQSVAGLRPLAHGLQQVSVEDSDRVRLQLVLNFFQNIPYNDLSTGKVRGFKGFSVPLEMIAENLGDCDSKSTAMMALLRTLMPERQTAMFLVPTHAFLGVAIKAQEGDSTYTHLGETYVLMEPTGPNLRPVGRLLPLSEAALDNDQLHGVIVMH